MAKTRAQMATAVLRKIGVVEANESPAAADAEMVKDQYNSKLEEWRDLNLVYWSADEIPEAVFQSIVMLMANEVQNEFGKTQTFDEQEARETVLLKKLRRHVARKASGVSTRAVYY